MDQCTHCIVKGNIKECLKTECSQHESWMVGEIRKENYNLRLTLQSIADDTETQTCGSIGMKRLAGYALDALSGKDWIDEFACTPPEYKYPTFEDWYEKVRKNDYKESWVDVWNSARELK